MELRSSIECGGSSHQSMRCEVRSCSSHLLELIRLRMMRISIEDRVRDIRSQLRSGIEVRKIGCEARRCASHRMQQRGDECHSSWEPYAMRRRVLASVSPSSIPGSTLSIADRSHRCSASSSNISIDPRVKVDPALPGSPPRLSRSGGASELEPSSKKNTVRGTFSGPNPQRFPHSEVSKTLVTLGAKKTLI